jgi:hypothetical protein
MDDKVASGIMSTIETLDLENLALKSYLKTCSRPLDDSQIDRLIEEAKKLPGLQERVSARWKQLRDQIQSDRTLEGALSKYSKWGSCLSTVRAIGCGCWFTNAAIYTLCFQHDSSLSGDMPPEKIAPYIGAAVLRQLPHLLQNSSSTERRELAGSPKSRLWDLGKSDYRPAVCRTFPALGHND